MGFVQFIIDVAVLGTFGSLVERGQIPSGNETTVGETSHIDLGRTRLLAAFAIPIDFPNDALKEDCQKNGGPTAYSALEAAARNFSSNCIGHLLNTTELAFDLATAYMGRKWDTVITKYCPRLPGFVECVNPLADLVEPCLTSADREILKREYIMRNSFYEYLCQNNGNRTASFFTNGGLECTDSKRDTLRQNCSWKNFGLSDTDLWLPSSARWIRVSSLVNYDPRFERLQTCVVQVMRTCENPIPANVVESDYDFLKRRQYRPNITAAQITT